MARKTGKNPQDAPLPEKDRKELLDELSSVQDMLSEDDSPETTDEDPPVLQPESPGEAPGNGEEQMPLLQPEEGESGSDPANERLRQALSERPNPFLSDAARKTAQKSKASPESSSPGPSPETSAAGTTTPQAGEGRAAASSGTGDTGAGAALTEEQMRALVDETLAAWLPKIERELRDKLMERLRNQQG